MPAAKGMTHMIPNHILRVGQTVCLETAQKTVSPHLSLTKPCGNLDDPDFDISLDNLNQLILELDPTFEPIHIPKTPLCISPPTGTVKYCNATLHKNFAFYTNLNCYFLPDSYICTRSTKYNQGRAPTCRGVTQHTTNHTTNSTHSLGLCKCTHPF